MENAPNLHISELASHFGYKTLSTPSLLRRIFSNAACDSILEIIEMEDASWRRITEIVKVAENSPSKLNDLLVSLRDSPKESPVSPEEVSGPDASCGEIDDTKKKRAKTAASFGLVVKPRTNISVVSSLLKIVAKSESIPDHIKHELNSCDTSTHEGVVDAWAILSEKIESGELNG